MLKYIEIGGQQRPVRYNQNALEEFEVLTGLSVLDGLTFKKVGHVKALAFCGLKHGYLESKDYKEDAIPFTITDVGRWLDMENTSQIFATFSRETSAPDSSPQEGDGSKKLDGVTSEA